MLNGFEKGNWKTYCKAFPEGMVFCPTCGVSTSSLETQTKPKKYIVTAAVTLTSFFLLIIAIVIVIVVVEELSYKKPISNIMNGIEKGSWITYSKAFPEELREQMESRGEKHVEDLTEQFESVCGKKFKISYKVTDKKKLNRDKLNEFKASIKSYNINRNNIINAYEVEVYITVEGENNEMGFQWKYTVGKILGKWYVLSDGFEAFNFIVIVIPFPFKIGNSIINVIKCM